MSIESEEKRHWYFTFGSGQRLFSCSRDGTHGTPPGGGIPVDGCYVKIYDTFNDTRKFMVQVFGSVWSSQYDHLPRVPGFPKWTDITVLLELYAHGVSPAELRGETATQGKDQTT